MLRTWALHLKSSQQRTLVSSIDVHYLYLKQKFQGENRNDGSEQALTFLSVFMQHITPPSPYYKQYSTKTYRPINALEWDNFN